MNESTATPSLREALERRPAIEAIRAFVERWHGIDLDVPRWHPPPDLPQSLALVLPHERRFCWQNHLTMPAPDPDDPSRRVFYVENQSVTAWAYRANGATNPSVVWRNDENEQWQDESMTLDEFVLTALVVEATIGGSYENGAYTQALPADVVEAATAPLVPIGKPWHWLHTQCYAGDEVIAFSFNARGQATWLQIAATRAAALEYLNPIIQADPLPWLEIRVDGHERYPVDGF